MCILLHGCNHKNCCFFKPIFCENFEIAAVQKDANLVELEKCCQTHIFLQNFVSIQPRTSPVKFAASHDNRPENSQPAAVCLKRPSWNYFGRVPCKNSSMSLICREDPCGKGPQRCLFDTARSKHETSMQRERSAKIKLKIKKTCFEN